MKKIILASALGLLSMGPAAGQSVFADQVQAAPFPSANMAAVKACEAQKRRQAGLNKGLAANYNAKRVQRECLAEQLSTNSTR